MNNELTVLNKNVNSKLDNIVTTINERSPTSSTFKTPDSEDYLMNFNNDIKNNMNNSINELKNYIKEIIDAKIDEKINNSNVENISNSNNNPSLNNTINELKNNVEAVNANINANNNNLINELMAKISSNNDQKLREMEERFNQKLEQFINSKNNNNKNEENNTHMNSVLENMDKSIKELKVSLNSKNSEIEKLSEMTELLNKNSSNNDKAKEEEQLKYMEFTKTLEEDLKQQLRKFKNDICNNINGTQVSSEPNENDNNEKSDKPIVNYDQDTIDYVKQIRDNVDKQLLEFRRALFNLSETIKTNSSSSSTQKGFNPEMIETIRSFRTEMKSQYQDFTEMIKQTLTKQDESNKFNKDLPNSGNKIIKDNSKFSLLINILHLFIIIIIICYNHL